MQTLYGATEGQYLRRWTSVVKQPMNMTTWAEVVVLLLNVIMIANLYVVQSAVNGN